MAGTNPASPFFNELITKGIENIVHKTIHSNHGILNDGTIKEEFKNSGHGNTPFEIALRKMKMFGLITSFEGKNDTYQLTDKGWQFETFEIERQKSLLPVQQMESVIATNRISRRSNRLSPAFAGVAALMAILSFTLQILPNSKQVKKIEQLQKQLTQEDSLLKIQQAQIDSLLIKVVRRDSEPKNGNDSSIR